MKKRFFLGAVAAVTVATASFVQAADVSAGVELNSAYVWRGITLNDGLVVQPSLLLQKESFEIFFWGNINIDDYDGTLETDEFSEIDIDLSYSTELVGLDVTFGVIQYLYPNDGSMISSDGDPIVQSGTAETYVKLTRGLGKGLSMRLEAFYDFDEVKDGYGKLALEHDGTVSDVLITSGASIAVAGRGREWTETGADGFHEYELYMSFAYALESGFGLSGRIAYTGSADKDVLPEQDTNVYGGAGIKYLF